MLLVFFGHHKAATTWIALIMNGVAAALRLRVLTIHSTAGWAGYATLGDMVRAEKSDLLLLTNARQADVETLPELRGFHVIRDPRDMIISGYFSHLFSHSEDGWPELPPHRRSLAELSRDEGLYAEIEFSGRFIDHMSAWDYEQTGILEIRMEDLVANPSHVWDSILAHLELKRPDEGSSLSDLLDRYSFTRLAGGRSPGEEDPTHHYRLGVSGDWRNHLTPQHLAAIHARYGDLVERLGYEW